MDGVSNALTGVAAHKARIADLIGVAPVVELPLADCLGLVLASDAVAPVALPPFDNSAMDGYAVRVADLAELPVVLPVPEDIPAGRTDVVPLEPGTAHRIMTGAPVPPGADAVVQVEWTDAGVRSVRIDRGVRLGQNVRWAEDDVKVGEVALRAGRVLGAAQLGLVSALGIPALPVRRRLRVLVLSTGSELVAPGEPLLPGQIYESNGLMLAAAVREAGGEAEQLRFVPDDVDRFRAVVEERIGGFDLLLTSGGVSAGAYEVVKDALTGRGVEFTKVAMQPGGPQGSGRYLGVPVATLPGNPVSAQVSFEVFVRPALRAAMGFVDVERPTAVARLRGSISSPSGRTQFRRGAYDAGSGQVVTPVGGPGSHLLSSLALSNCLIEVPAEVDELADGDEVLVRLL
ncbi:molybdopterin molybdotransferase MoeA [Actinosynnema pretiosum subsp. pretiosum]|uniref:Molybdopterin molybdenumtransferase n=2 Tax=Actinosynnema TaxID=40566 RepID=C6WHV4_ACTMD|nr:gephyrin-like molybdotransferase Glp [Actinosynnema mirum]ACU34405.1 molybdenum cofactor synthesis domain protein [Actinosynnema mirum DSM 43827]QUF01529.1 molybdopterin molybdotransferase MoeA [Actinosynnema pretiosum subsp. pretiosum]